MPTPDIPRDDAQAALDARRELGPELEPAVVEAFVERVERAIDERVDARLAERSGARSAGRARRRDESSRGLGDALLPVVSLGVAIPLTAIAAGTAGFLAVLVVWLGIVAVNWAYAQGRR